MANKIVLVSDDSNFFDYIRTKLELRKSDELFTYDFDSIPEKRHLIDTAVIIINSENSKEKTLDLISFFKDMPIIIMAYNEDDIYRRKCYRSGALDFMTLLIPDSDFRSRLVPALTLASILEKNKFYRNILASQKIISKDNEVLLDYDEILEKELEDINKGRKKAFFAAISPNETSKFLIQPSQIESIILNNIRKGDLLMNYAPNKYFLLLYDTDKKSLEKLWNKISTRFPQQMYIGYCNITNQKRQQLINEVLNNLHSAINKEKNIVVLKEKELSINSSEIGYSNFKMFRQEFSKKIQQIVSPVFYQIQQKYSTKISGVVLEQNSGDSYGSFYIKGRGVTNCFKITCPGFSKINIDISCQKDGIILDTKRISLEPNELEAGLLEDLLEQFILEYKEDLKNDFRSK